MSNDQLMKKLFESILNLIFPPRCEVCRQDSQDALCHDCFKEIKFMKPHLGIYSAAAYDGTLRAAIKRFKFKKRKRLAQALGFLLVKYVSQIPGLEMREMDLIIPVPLHEKRLKERGFNQARVLAETLSHYYGIPVKSSLARIKNTKAQFDLERKERFSNIKGAFKVVDNSVNNKRILLFDDIYTTGATIMECSKALKAAGAKRIEVLTLSRAVE